MNFPSSSDSCDVDDGEADRLVPHTRPQQPVIAFADATTTTPSSQHLLRQPRTPMTPGEWGSLSRSALQIDGTSPMRRLDQPNLKLTARAAALGFTLNSDCETSEEDDVDGGNGDALVERSATIFELALTIFALLCSSLTMSVGNKYVLEKWPHAELLLTAQCTSAILMVLILFLCWKLSGGAIGVEVKPVTTRQLQVYGVAASLLTMQLFTSMRALPLVTVATKSMFTMSKAPITAFVEWLILGETFTLGAIAALCIIVFSSVVYLHSDFHSGLYDSAGYAWCAANTGLWVSSSVLMRRWNRYVFTFFTSLLSLACSHAHTHSYCVRSRIGR